MKPEPGDVRSVAAWIIDRTLSARSSSEPYLRRFETRFGERDRALLREISLGTLRWLRRLDEVIRAASGRSSRQIDSRLRSPLRIGVYQLLFLDRIPAHAAVSEAVAEGKRRRGPKGGAFLNAVLRKIARRSNLAEWPVSVSDPIERLAVETSHPTYLVRRWLDRFGETATRSLLEANNRRKPQQLLSFRDRGGRSRLSSSLAEDGIVARPSTLSALGLVTEQGDALTSRAFRAGDLYLQDEASQVTACLLPPEPGARVLDLAAAPGGKSFSMLAWQPDLRLVAGDLDVARMMVMRANAARLGRSVASLVADANCLPLEARFDRVVVDLPCTGSGTLRKHPELKWRIDQREIDRLALQGRQILESAVLLVDHGGLLMVISCSLEAEENEAVVQALLHDRSELEPAKLEREIDTTLASHVVGPGCWRILPAGVHDGFTVHVLRHI